MQDPGLAAHTHTHTTQLHMSFVLVIQSNLADPVFDTD